MPTRNRRRKKIVAYKTVETSGLRIEYRMPLSESRGLSQVFGYNNSIRSGPQPMVQGLYNKASMMKCMYCQGEMLQGHAPYHIDRNTIHVRLDSVTAWVSNQCGEPYFEEAEVQAIQEIIRTLDEKAETLLQAT
jgi:YgiT-type zinc finger domain-containing protein